MDKGLKAFRTIKRGLSIVVFEIEKQLVWNGI